MLRQLGEVLFNTHKFISYKLSFQALSINFLSILYAVFKSKVLWILEAFSAHVAHDPG
jgi:hypothetical protein